MLGLSETAIPANWREKSHKGFGGFLGWKIRRRL